MQTCYVFSDQIDSIAFVEKEEAEKYLRKKIFDVVGDFKFSVEVLRSFRDNHSNIEWYKERVEQLIEYATNQNSNIEDLLEVWNDVFPDDQLELTEETIEE
jgi:hypothetical protein